MLRYVGRLGDSKLYPRDAAKELAIDEVIGLAGDFDRAWMPCLYLGMRPATFGYPEDFTKTDEGKELVRSMRVSFVEEKLPQFLTWYAEILRTNGNAFICGSQPTIADCVLLPQLAKFRAGFIDHVPTNCLDSHPDIIQYIDRMMAIPEIAAWYNK